MIFVFCSNLLGKHNDEISQQAVMHFGAKDGMGNGFVGSSYALPIRSHPSEVTSTVFDSHDHLLSKDEIIENIKIWYEFARNSKYHFQFVASNINIADFASFLKEAGPIPNNVTLDKNVLWFINSTRRAIFK